MHLESFSFIVGFYSHSAENVFSLSCRAESLTAVESSAVSGFLRAACESLFPF